MKKLREFKSDGRQQQPSIYKAESQELRVAVIKPLDVTSAYKLCFVRQAQRAAFSFLRSN